MNVIFMGTPAFAATCLGAVAASGHTVQAVVTRPDKPRGRGRKVAAPAVKTRAVELGVPVLQPESLRDPAFADALRGYAPDLFVVVAFVILPPALIALPARGAVNLHASLLPDYRGAAPIQWAVINGETRTGLTTFLIEEKVDTGNIILQHEMDISENETAGELTARMEHDGAALLVRTLDILEAGPVEFREQRALKGRKAPKLSKADGTVDWTQPAGAVHNRIRGCTPVPGAHTVLDGRAVKVFAGRRDGTGDGVPGRILGMTADGALRVACGNGTALALGELQLEGKRRMPAGDFMRGAAVPEGACFG